MPNVCVDRVKRCALPCSSWAQRKYLSVMLHLRLAFLVLCAVAVFSNHAAAQTPALSGNPALRAEYEALFQKSLTNPGDLDASFKFAEAATTVGDFEAAIGAMERMLFFNPNLPRVRLELGVLYFRLGSYEMARSYFNTAIEGQGTPDDVRRRVNAFLSEIDRRVKPNQLSVFVQTGFRSQSNANAGPNGILVRAIGFDAVLGSEFRRKQDLNWFGLSTVRHVYDLENQRGDVLETQFVGYYASQNKFNRLNTGLVEVNFGPRLALMPDAWIGSSIKPYALASKVSLGDNPYLSSWGGGVSLALPFGLAVIEPGFEIRQRVYEDSRDYRNAKEQTGQLTAFYVTGSGALIDTLRWQARLAQSRNEARFSYNSYDQTSFDVSFPYEFAAPSFVPGGRRWTLSPSVGFAVTRYDDPNPIVDPVLVRRDREWRTSLALDAPLTDYLGFGVQVQYNQVNSRVRNYDTRNFSVMAGPTGRF
jgi:tetratricopeptide (TPR) repeat protein